MQLDQANEVRNAAIGLTNDLMVLFIVHLVRGGEELESIRIVSARMATPQERKHYENQ